MKHCKIGAFSTFAVVGLISYSACLPSSDEPEDTHAGAGTAGVGQRSNNSASGGSGGRTGSGGSGSSGNAGAGAVSGSQNASAGSGGLGSGTGGQAGATNAGAGAGGADHNYVPCGDENGHCCNYETGQWTMPVCWREGTAFVTSCLPGTGSLASTKGPCPPAEICKCSGAQFCDSVACSSIGSCVNRPSNCAADDVPVCGCDNKTYPSLCEAQKAGVDVGISCPSTPSGYRACGPKLCKVDKYFCRMTPGTPEWSYECVPLPSACKSGSRNCSCLSSDRCGSSCTEFENGLGVICSN